MRKLLLAFLLAATCLAPLMAGPYDGGPSLVVLDPGHGGEDPGAVTGDVLEKDLALAFSLKIAEALEEKGVPVRLTRSDDSTLTLQERCDKANSSELPAGGYPILLSVHMNSAGNSTASGFEVYTRLPGHDQQMLDEHASDSLALTYASYDNEELNEACFSCSEDLAGRLCQAFARRFPSIRMRGVKSSDLWVLNASWMPAVLIEVGFMSNPDELERLCAPAFQEDFADLVADVVISLY